MMKLRWISILVLLVFALGCKDDKKKKDDDDDREESATCKDVAKHMVTLMFADVERELENKYGLKRGNCMQDKECRSVMKEEEKEREQTLKNMRFVCEEKMPEKDRECVLRAPSIDLAKMCKKKDRR